MREGRYNQLKGKVYERKVTDRERQEVATRERKEEEINVQDDKGKIQEAHREINGGKREAVKTAQGKRGRKAMRKRGEKEEKCIEWTGEQGKESQKTTKERRR